MSIEVTKRENSTAFYCVECGVHESFDHPFYTIKINHHLSTVLCGQCFHVLQEKVWDVDTDNKLSVAVIPTDMHDMPKTCDSCSNHNCRLAYTGAKLKPLYKLKRHNMCPLVLK